MTNPKILLMLTIIYEEIKKYQNAVKTCEQYLTIEPKYRHDKTADKKYKNLCKLAGKKPVSRK